MAKRAAYSTAARNAAVDAIVAILEAAPGARARFYTGAAPADPGTAATGTLLAEFTARTFAAAVAGLAAMDGVPVEVAVLVDGMVGYCRLTTDAGVGVIDLNVGVGADFNVQVSTTNWVAGTNVRINSCTISHPLTVTV